MNESSEAKPGDKCSLFCSVCSEERTFVWETWPGVEYYGYPPKQEQGWVCSSCGEKLPAP